MSSLLVTPLKHLIGLAARSRPGRAVIGIAPDSISDDRFRDQLFQVRNLKLFLFRENVAFKQEDLPKIGLEGLDAIKYSVYGRAPTAAEWNLLDEKQSALSSYLDGRLRWKLKLSRMRKYYTTIPVVFLFIALIALAGGNLQDIFGGEMALATRKVIYSSCVILWTLALGGLGACAFLGTTMISETARMNAIVRAADIANGQLPDSEFDLSDRDLIWTRVVVGILFGFLLGLPLAAGSLGYVIAQIENANIGSTKIDTELAQNMALTLLPFVFGFSTTLVLGVMERFMASIRAIFGIGTK